MKRNMSNIDRIVRTVIALIFAYLYFAGIVTGAFGIVLLVVAVVFLATAIFAICPIYSVLKLSTYKA